MKNINLAIIVATMFVITEQSIIGYHDSDHNSDNDSQPTHQGWGRFGTAIENTLTLHPGNAVNALATGDQSDTNFGWHENDDNRIKANRAHTHHNNNRHERHENNHRNERRNDHRDERHELRHKEEHANHQHHNAHHKKEKKSWKWFW